MLIRDFLAIVKQPGKIVLPVMTKTGPIYVEVKKKDLIFALSNRKPEEKSPWKIFGFHDDGSLLFDIQE